MNKEHEQNKSKNAQNKAAIVAIIGRPSAGKSTFLNTASNEKISIVSAVPQTTRNAVKGIVHSSFGQLVFVDTPGYHESNKKFNIRLKAITKEQLDAADAVLYIIDSTRKPGGEEDLTANLVCNYTNKTIIALNKTDLPASNTAVSRVFLSKKLPTLSANNIFEISAKEDEGIKEVLKALYKLAPIGENLYPENYYTDQEVDFRIAEVIREQAINRLQEEIPHSIYIDISDMEWRRNGKTLWVRAFLVVERESQKGIVIGKGASMIKTIRVESIKACRKLFDYRVDIDLQVKVNKNWRKKDYILDTVLR
ncbi:MAG TPA: GTPase Era [Treponemataceae bacterium]|nr:GTPase Era [Treponemataceae bacterium]